MGVALARRWEYQRKQFKTWGLLRNLMKVLNPYKMLDLDAMDVDQFNSVRPISKYEEDDGCHRDWKYDVGRIAYFRERYRRRLVVQPPNVFCGKYGFSLGDGHHRMIGAWQACVRRIDIMYDGGPEALKWLQDMRFPAPYYVSRAHGEEVDSTYLIC